MLFQENTILDLQVLDYLSLLAIQPTGQGEDEQMPGLHQKTHGNGSEVGEGSHSGTLTILCSVALVNWRSLSVSTAGNAGCDDCSGELRGQVV